MKRNTSRPSSATLNSTKKASTLKSTSSSSKGSTLSPGKIPSNKTIQSMNQSEVEQLQLYVKTRSQELDSEIINLRNKLRNAPDPSGKINVKLKELKSTKGSIENDSIKNLSGSNRLNINGRSLGKVDLNPYNVLHESKSVTPQLTQTLKDTKKEALELGSPGAKNDKKAIDEKKRNYLVTFLAKLKIKQEDSGYSPQEVRELMIPSDLAIPGHYFVPLKEVTDVLQTDLLFPITKQDQLLLIEEYGNNRSEIDIHSLLSDAGLWVGKEEDLDLTSAPLSLSPEPSPFRSRESKRRDLEASPSSRYKLDSSINSEDPDISSSDIFSSLKLSSPRDSILDKTSSTLAELDDLHKRILDERDYDDFDILKEKKKTNKGKDDLVSTLTNSPQKLLDIPSSRNKESKERKGIAEDYDFDKKISKDNSSKPKSSLYDSEDIETMYLNKAKPSDDKYISLEEENKKLKEELSSFDSNFFEELEDLKYRYCKLQEIVGEDPKYPLEFNRRKTRSLSPSKEGVKDNDLPLQRYAWSVRNSMRAMDRADYGTPLVEGRRAAHAYTYAPGARSNSDKFREEFTDQKGSTWNGAQHLGGSFSTKKSLDFSTSNDIEDSLFGGKTFSKGNSMLLKSRTSEGFEAIDGGIHGIGSGKYSSVDNELGGSFSNLCERRLAFELASHPNPIEATKLLIERAQQLGLKNKEKEMKEMKLTNKDEKPKIDKSGRTYLTVPQLSNLVESLKLNISQKEVEVLATGFASDGKGGIDINEFSEAVRSLVFNLVGTHALSKSTMKGSLSRDFDDKSLTRKSFTGSIDEDEALMRQSKTKKGKDNRSKDYLRLLQDVAEGIVTYDKRAILGTSSNFTQTLLKPFVEVDSQGSGHIPFEKFCYILKDMGAMLSYEEYKVLALPFAIFEDLPPSKYPSSNLNHLESFRTKQLQGSLSGRSKVQSSFGSFLSNHALDLDNPEDRSVDDLTSDTLINYADFVNELVNCLNELLDRQGGLPVTPRLSWVLREFEFVDLLLSQLEGMTASNRRKVLITLQYALEAADIKELGELDGFALLTALMNSGFRLQRYHRVQLLKAAEDSGGALDYHRLVLTLLQTVVTWTQSEKDLVYKILKCIGLTVEERRQWLGKLKKEIMKRSTASSTKMRSKGNSSTKSTIYNESEIEDDDIYSLTVSPSVFLGVLRDLGVILNPEEEAVLLDCLDAERIAKLNIIKLQKSVVATKSFRPPDEDERRDNSNLQIYKFAWNSETQSSNKTSRGGGEFQLPMVDYQSFIRYIARHCGDWIQANPKLFQALSEEMSNIQNPLQALQEFMLILRSFDESNRGLISQRSFLIASHRSRLFAAVPDEIINELIHYLTVDGGGEVEYKPFTILLRSICTQIDITSAESSSNIIEQLIRNASDGDETLFPLRNWLLSHLDINLGYITLPEINALLREFSVVYRPDDLDMLILEIGGDIEASSVTIAPKEKTLKGRTIHRELDSPLPRTKVLDLTKFINVVMKSRAPWYRRNIPLTRHLLKTFKKIAQTMARSKGEDLAAAGSAPAAVPENGYEGLVIKKILARVDAFAVEEPAVDSLSLFHTSEDNIHDIRLVEYNVVDYVFKSMGISLTREDIQFLCDASDPLPEANRINPFLLYDLLRVVQAVGEDDDLEGRHLIDTERLSEAAIYALNHLRDLVWKAKPTKRDSAEWKNDVKCIFKGFDALNTDFISFDDFILGLLLMNIRMSHDLLRDIPYVGKVPGTMVQYNKILSYILSEEPSKTIDPKLKSKSSSLLDEEDDDLQLTGKGLDKTKITIKTKPIQKDSPVHGVLRCVRKSICDFIVSNKNIEEAWLEMLRVFTRFDPQENNYVNSRDFCLAVSVLLQGDDIVLSKAEWEEVISYFSIKSEKTGIKPAPSDAKVDYMLFCEMVLDPVEVEKRLGDMKNGRDKDISAKIDRSKSFLSTKPVRGAKEAKEAFAEDIKGRSYGRSSSQDKGDIESKFESSRQRIQAEAIKGRIYGDSKRIEPKAEEPKTRAPSVPYRVAQTKGQASRDAYAKTTSAPMPSASSMSKKQVYDSSHKRAGSGQVRFNWTS